MALTFGGATSDKVDVPAATTINDLAAFTVLVWHFPTSQTSGRALFNKTQVSVTTKRAIWAPDTNDLAFDVGRATANASLITAQNFATGQWWYHAFTYDESDGPRVFWGDLSTLAAEASYASAPTVGSGGTNADAAAALLIGNRPNATSAYQGRIASFQFIAKRMSVGEIKRQQFRFSKIAESRVFYQLGHGPTTQPDWSGNGNVGTVTGATQGAHVPLGLPFGI